MKIAVFGKLRSGKSEVCKFIQEILKCDVLDFGDALKECLAIAYPNSKYVKDRNLLIGFGQHLRMFDNDIWVNALKHRIASRNTKNIIVTGVRQSNEYDMLKCLGFVFVKVEAPERSRIDRSTKAGDKFNLENLNNITETELDDFKYDFLITNDGGFKDLIIDTNNVLDEIWESLNE